MKPHLDAMYRTALRMSRDRAAAEDIVQECCLRAYRAFADFQSGTNFKAWVFRILTNICIDRARQARLAQMVPVDSVVTTLPSDSVWDDPERQAQASDLRSDIQAALDRLPQELRMVVLLVLIEELSYAEAAENLDLPVSTVRSRLHRAREELRVSLAPHTNGASKTNVLEADFRAARSGRTTLQ
ncbi:MAG: sigma-70 family RNA polymerase sigma factor [Hyphomicrobiales bacterium]|nr:sigma-70 family RNA polymerase sigma factor [Hyphomicrobiales bacterium]